MNNDNFQLADSGADSLADGSRCKLVTAKGVWLGVVALTALAVFSKTAGAGFLFWDDNTNIYDNPHLKLGLSLEGIRWMFSDVQYLPRYMPLGWLSLAVNYQIGGLNPVWFHVGNLLFHSVNSALVFLLLHRLLSVSRAASHPRPEPHVLPFCSGLGALLWAIHPLRVEAVAWASARLYQQSLFFLLISCLAYLRAHCNPGTPRRQRAFLRVSIVAFLCSLLTYPTALGFLFVLVALDVWFLRRFASIGPWWKAAARPIWLEKFPFALAAALVLLLTLAGRAHCLDLPAPLSLKAFPLSERVMQACYMWAYYLWKPLVPVHLSPMYTTLISFNPWTAPFLLSASLVLGISAGLWLNRRNCPGLMVLWLCYLAVLFPVVGLTEHPHFPSDRYSLMPAILSSLLVSAALLKASRQLAWRARAFVTSAAVLALLAVLSIRQCDIWQDDAHLLPCIIASVENHPARARPELISGVLLMRQGRLAEAEQSFRNAVHFQPQNSLAHANLGDALSQQEKAAEAIPVYERALALNPTDVHARQGLAVALGATRRFDEAAAQFREALRTDPNNATALHNLAITLHHLGQTELSRSYAARAQEILRRSQATL